MKCEACGGDGLIEIGAYRGDSQTDTRSCLLCGGSPTEPAPDAVSFIKSDTVFKQSVIEHRSALETEEGHAKYEGFEGLGEYKGYNENWRHSKRQRIK